jgi:chemotaxis protein MotA
LGEVVLLDITTLAGMVVGIGALLVAMFMKHIPYSMLINGPAITLIIFGTIAAILNAFPLSEFKKIPKLFGALFKSKKTGDKFETIKLFIEYAQIVRKDGILAIEKKLDEVYNPFVKRGMTLLVSGVKSSEIETVLLDDLSSMEKRHHGFASVFSQAGSYAPTLGVLGAVMGLIAAMGNMEDQKALSAAIAAAFIATLYGIFTGYVLWNPFANKLKRKSREEVLHNEIVIAGVLALANGDPPYLVQDKLLSYLSQKEKDIFTSMMGV